MPPFGRDNTNSVKRHEQLRQRKKLAEQKKQAEVAAEPKKAPEQSPILQMAALVGERAAVVAAAVALLLTAAHGGRYRPERLE